MSGAFTLAGPGAPFQWQAEPYPGRPPVRRGLSVRRVLVLCLGLPLTAAAVAASWSLLRPPGFLQTRIVADIAGPQGRAALAEAAMRVGAGPVQSASLQEGGNTLLLRVDGDDPVALRHRLRSVTDALLDLPLPPGPERQAPVVPPSAGGPVGPASGAAAERSRLQSALDATDTRLAAVSASLAGVMRDLAATARALVDRRPGRDTLDRAAASLAELQLQRIQLQSRYQDDYPAVLALDGQIRSTRSFLQDEGRRVDGAARVAEPADPALAAERDRLRAELSQLTTRRSALAADLSALPQPAAGPPERSPPDPRAVPSPAPVLGPVLLEAETIAGSGPDLRWTAAPATAALGLLLGLVAWLRPGRQDRTAPAGLLLQRMDALLLARGIEPGSLACDALPGPLGLSTGQPGPPMRRPGQRDGWAGEP